jgi:hypothetical protein
MAQIQPRKKSGEVVYLERFDIAITSLVCKRCKSTISVGSQEKLISLKCKCQCALIYRESYLEGRMDVIDYERYRKKREYQDGEKDRIQE